MTAHRLPPMPERKGWGWCTWCADEIRYPAGHKRAGESNSRRCWHAECVQAYLIAISSAAQRNACSKRDGGYCAICGRHDPLWQADHIVPLIHVPHDVSLSMRACYWGLINLQTLCLRCHGKKSGREAWTRHRVLARTPDLFILPPEQPRFLKLGSPARLRAGACA